MKKLVGSARVARLATVAPDGSPHLVPVCFVALGDVVYSAVDHKPKRSTRLRRITNVEATRHVCLLVDEYAEDWTSLWWVRLDGVGRVVDAPDEQARAVSALVAKYPQDSGRAPTGPVLRIDVTRRTGWSARDGESNDVRVRRRE